ncbi:hypothetical protein [Microbacterium sp. NPDC077184]|uniref:hypothetical protein n=1 Tax=Microbacterium sp. NPDC077184 TaxID=3154764 RepID=UPI0034328C62
MQQLAQHNSDRDTAAMVKPGEAAEAVDFDDGQPREGRCVGDGARGIRLSIREDAIDASVLDGPRGRGVRVSPIGTHATTMSGEVGTTGSVWGAEEL